MFLNFGKERINLNAFRKMILGFSVDFEHAFVNLITFMVNVRELNGLKNI